MTIHSIPTAAADVRHMREALEAAKDARAAGDLPVGAVVIRDGEVIARAGNGRHVLGDPTAHAEIIALRAAAKVVGHWRLHGCALYVTLEPCVMCAGALVLSRVDRVVFATADPKAGAVQSLYRVLHDARLNHRPEVVGGVLAEEAAEMLTGFFRALRRKAAPVPRRGDREAEGA